MRGWGWGWWMGLGMLVFWGFVAFVIWAIVRNPQAPRGAKPPAEDILAERYARGEISAEEYSERKRVLAKS